MFRATIRPTAAAIILAAATAIQLSAQSVIAITPTRPNPAVDRLHAQAAALFQKPASYATAARLLERAADMQSRSEYRRVQDRAMAARLWYYAGDKLLARTTMQEAAEEALGLGLVAEAAHHYTDACLYAIEQGEAKTARMLLDAARRLTTSPHLAAAERAELNARTGSVEARLALR